MPKISKLGAMLLCLCLTLGTHEAKGIEPVEFEAGSLIIPMDTTYQDMGMLTAFGLVYSLLKYGIPVHWVIAPGKQPGDADFVVNAADHKTNQPFTHAYRGGPFVVEAAYASMAHAIIHAWQVQHTTTVHHSNEPFVGYVRKKLVSAPTIAVFADGNEDIAFGYLNAAAIPDSQGNSWPIKKDSSLVYPNHPDVLTVAEIAGPTTTNHADGALFDAWGNPTYCQLMTMHWSVKDVVDEVVAEMREYLQHPVHLFAECQAVNAIENNPYGRFLTPNGFLIDKEPSAVTFLNFDLTFAQLDGPWGITGGSEPSYSLPAGDTYFDKDVVMITQAGTPVGKQDVWMTGYVDGACPIVYTIGMPGAPVQNTCQSAVGKVSYLGGHAYDTKVPISQNPKTQGTRIFLNSLFEADCASEEGQPKVTMTLDMPAVTNTPETTVTVTLVNAGPGVLLKPQVTVLHSTDMIVTAGTEPYVYEEADQKLTWELPVLGNGGVFTGQITFQLGEPGLYIATASSLYTVGVTPKVTLPLSKATEYNPLANPDCPNGDINGDTESNVLDVQCLLLLVLNSLGDGTPLECNTNSSAADLNCDGAYNITDIQLAIFIALGQPFFAEVDADGNQCVDLCELE
ncbi:MAG: hypothetical protein HUU55_13320 [Myxococcales bacterium]|nr:hypothetical protein [Myxococcales bacterium]